ncbi:CDC27 family protein [Algoriphagus taiwanensis]|uniref:Tetratricopeptide repeat protein n=1 Tax=Algoriphagus taiwanensis TaxID=1445656 RepID=A0ABQ6Q488_9BACT|nr:hypothetical protein Ataiwa_32730 [Algoriphagus taiwanensis]
MDQEELINAYLEGKLSPEDQRLFEQLLENQPEYKTILEEHRQLKIAVTLEERSKIKDFLEELDQKEKGIPKSKGGLRSWIYSGIAACAIVLAGLFLWTSLSMTPGEKIYKSYYETYPNLIAPTVRGESQANLESDAFLAFDNKDYEKAAVLFENLQHEPDSDYAVFYLGICQLELGRPEKAIPLFLKVREDASNPDQITATWYAALGYFQLNKLEEGTQAVNKVARTEGHPLQAKAQELAEILK